MSASSPKRSRSSPAWRYDTFVPIVFAGPRIPAQRVYRRVHTIDVAPSLAAYLGVKRPSGAVGKPLEELFRAPAER